MSSTRVSDRGSLDGVFVTQDQQNDGSRQNFKLVPWPAIEAVIREASGAQPTSSSTAVSGHAGATR